ncbi:hypothetical protein T459_27190 [Capsicum annuum]|uniref:Retrovirus-related Pol polyprotein from transposon TNT 1-94-like beta-barrel domain-containing protein n=1 Tax=Capsicum annuum TaxID=4072 RepID=A0A2G2YD78_CAPAN|nr:hypothetical protein T459_27190 [Capsicum annuum]
MAESKKEVDNLCTMLSECKLVGNPQKWWMDSGATRYVYANKELFAIFSLAQGEEKIYMANSATAKIEGTGKVCLKMTSGKMLTLDNVLAENMMYNGKSHHIRRRHNIVRELHSSGIITVDYVKSKDNVSDSLTKDPSREGVERTSKGMGLRPRTSQHSCNST